MTCGNGWSAASSGSRWGTRSGPRSSSGDARRSPTRCPRSSCRGRVAARLVDRRHRDGSEPMAVARRARAARSGGRAPPSRRVARDRSSRRREPHAVGAAPGSRRRRGCGGAVRGRTRPRGLGGQRVGDVLRAAGGVPRDASRAPPRGGSGALRDHPLGRALPDRVPRGHARHGSARPRRRPGRRWRTP